MRRVALRGEPVRASGSELPLVLAHRRAALRVAVLPEAGGRIHLHAGEGVVRLALRAPREQEALRVEAAARVLRRQPALVEAQLVVGAPGDGVVALPRVERPLDHAQPLDQLGDDEVRVRVAVAVEVAALVDGDAADGELDVLPFARVEAAEEDLLGVALAPFVGEQDARRELQEIARVGVRDRRERSDGDVEVRRADVRRRRTAAHVHLFDGRRRSRRRGRADGGEDGTPAAAPSRGTAGVTGSDGSVATGATTSGAGAGGAK